MMEDMQDMAEKPEDRAQEPEKSMEERKEQTVKEPEKDAEPDEKTLLSNENADLRKRLLQAGGRISALSLGVTESRIPFVMKLANLEGIDVTQDTAEGEITAAIKEVLARIPEWKREGGSGDGPKSQSAGLNIGGTGAHNRMPYWTDAGRQGDIAASFRQGIK